MTGKLLFYQFLVTIFVATAASSAILNAASDDAVLEAIREHKHLLILFAKKGCDGSCRYERSVLALREDFEATFTGGRVIRAENSQLVRLYSPQKREPSLIFLRTGVPLLYDDADPDDPDAILSFFSEHREPLVRELDDSTFEHLTQAASGATTGDWLVLFYEDACVECQRLHATWETVAAKLKLRGLNVARVNRGARGAMTAKRFRVESSPQFMLLRHGRFYRYNLQRHDLESFVGFATGWFKGVGAEVVPPLASPFDALLDRLVQRLKHLPRTVEELRAKFTDLPAGTGVILVIGATLLVVLLVKLLPKSSVAEEKKDEKKKNEEEKEEKEEKPAAGRRKKATKKE